MAAILLRFPTAASPTATVTLNPALVTVQYQRTPLQQRLVALSGRAYIVSLSSAIEVLVELNIEDLHGADVGSFSGWTTLMTFFTTTTNFSALTFDCTDADATTTNVRLWSTQISLREAEGRALVEGRFSGSLLLRKEL